MTEKAKQLCELMSEFTTEELMDILGDPDHVEQIRDAFVRELAIGFSKTRSEPGLAEVQEWLPKQMQTPVSFRRTRSFEVRVAWKDGSYWVSWPWFSDALWVKMSEEELDRWCGK